MKCRRTDRLFSGLFFRLLPYQVLLLVIRHGIVIRVAILGDDIMIRIIDDCKAFDPMTRSAAPDSGEGYSGTGIKIVSAIAKTTEYQNLLGLNILTMRL